MYYELNRNPIPDMTTASATKAEGKGKGSGKGKADGALKQQRDDTWKECKHLFK